MTADAWATLPEDAEGELVHGTLEEEEVPDPVHELIVAWFICVLGGWLGDRGIVLGSDLKFVLGARSGRKPDVSLFLTSDGLPARRGAVRTPPYLMIEVISPSPRDVQRDRIAKPSEYAAFGVKHLWIVDPDARTVEGFALDKGFYARPFAGSDGVVEPPGFDGLRLDLDELWRETDRLG